MSLIKCLHQFELQQTNLTGDTMKNLISTTALIAVTTLASFSSMAQTNHVTSYDGIKLMGKIFSCELYLARSSDRLRSGALKLARYEEIDAQGDYYTTTKAFKVGKLQSDMKLQNNDHKAKAFCHAVADNILEQISAM